MKISAEPANLTQGLRALFANIHFVGRWQQW